MNKPLRIGLNAETCRTWMGGIVYIQNIILALASLPPEVRKTFEICVIYGKAKDANQFSQIKSHIDRTYTHDADFLPRTLANKVRWKILNTAFKQGDPRFEEFVKRHNIDFVYPYRNPNPGRISFPCAAWIPDFQQKHLPQFFSQEEINRWDRDFKLMADYDPIVVLSSKTAESDFHKFFPEQSHKSRVLTFKTSAPSEWYEPDPQGIQQKYSLPDRFFLISNQFWLHKNHLLVFQALELLQKQSIYPVVVCTGELSDYRRPQYLNTLLQTIHQSGIAHQVYLLGLIPRQEQIQLMRRSVAVIQPSLFEGWSTVVEDGICLGKQMIISDLPVNLEQNPPNSRFFERNSPESLASILADWWEHLSPGPNLEQEAIARTNSLREVQDFGYRFLEIVKAALE